MNTRKEHCYGIIPLCKKQDGWYVFLVQHHKNAFWGFPKGHKELHETPLQTATRELVEETGLQVKSLLREEPLIEHYTFLHENTKIEKTVSFYFAITTTEAIIDQKELLDGKWIHFLKLEETISYVEGKALARDVLLVLKNYSGEYT